MRWRRTLLRLKKFRSDIGKRDQFFEFSSRLHEALNRFSGMRILVMLLLDTLPMLGNVLLLCFFVFFIFGIIGVQLWAGVLRRRCHLELNETMYPRSGWVVFTRLQPHLVWGVHTQRRKILFNFALKSSRGIRISDHLTNGCSKTVFSECTGDSMTKF